MSKYPISREFFPFNLFAPPINEKFLKLAAANMNAPGKFLNAKGFRVEKEHALSYDGAQVPFFVVSPDGIEDNAPCLFYIHGGGFVLKAAGYHYTNCLRYAKEAGCRVVFPDYRLAPEHPFPVFYEDCYSVLIHVYENASKYGIDTDRIGIGGDSAGSTLAAGMCIMANERNIALRFCFQMLPYPFMDARNNSESCRKYTDTPMWNSSLSDRIQPMTKVSREDHSYVWYSPVENDDFTIFPPSYIETAEFDCLHDDGILFAECLERAGVEVVLNETKGTMHGYDIVTGSPTAKDSMKQRIAFMKNRFGKNK